MKWIGLSGGIATGKSTVSRSLVKRGIPVIDADVLAREAVAAGTDGHRAVVSAFGPDAVSPSGELNRKYIAAIVFADPKKRFELEAIIHPKVRELAAEKKQALEKEGRPLAFYDVPLLFEKNLQDLFDTTAVVACDRATQLSRLIARDGLTVEEAERRLAAQLPIDEKVKLAGHVIWNNGDLTELEREIDAFLAKL